MMNRLLMIMLALVALTGCAVAPVAVDESVPEPMPLAIGDTVEGSLTEGDLQLPRGEFCDEYSLEGQAGQMISIRMASEDFDTYLIFLDPDADPPQVDNDDFGPGTDSGLDVELETSGVVHIGATSYATHSTGDYTLSVTLAEESD